jgi:hypothetical protein
VASSKRELTDEQKAGELFNRLARTLQGKPGHIAMTAAVNLAVYGAKGVGIELDRFVEVVRKTWEQTADPAARRRG